VTRLAVGLMLLLGTDTTMILKLKPKNNLKIQIDETESHRKLALKSLENPNKSNHK